MFRLWVNIEILLASGVTRFNNIIEGSCTGMPEVAEGKGCNWLTKGHTP